MKNLLRAVKLREIASGSKCHPRLCPGAGAGSGAAALHISPLHRAPAGGHIHLHSFSENRGLHWSETKRLTPGCYSRSASSSLFCPTYFHRVLRCMGQRCHLGCTWPWLCGAAVGAAAALAFLVEGSPLASLTGKSWGECLSFIMRRKSSWSDSSCLSLTPTVGVWINASGWVPAFWVAGKRCVLQSLFHPCSCGPASQLVRVYRTTLGKP